MLNPNSDLEDDSLTPEDECEVYGHTFEGYDTISEICMICNLIREYPPKDERVHESPPTDELHTCRTESNHMFDQSGVCIYCHKTEERKG